MECYKQYKKELKKYKGKNIKPSNYIDHDKIVRMKRINYFSIKPDYCESDMLECSFEEEKIRYLDSTKNISDKISLSSGLLSFETRPSSESLEFNEVKPTYIAQESDAELYYNEVPISTSVIKFATQKPSFNKCKRFININPLSILQNGLFNKRKASKLSLCQRANQSLTSSKICIKK